LGISLVCITVRFAPNSFSKAERLTTIYQF
jgi:hypothetical protein